MSAKSLMWKLAVPLAAGTLLLGACGDSDGGGGDVAAFCDMSAELEASAQAGELEFPSADELQAAADAAPSEIRDEMQTLVDAFGRLEEGDASVLQDPEIQEASEAITAFEAERCATGTEQGAAGDDPLAELEDDLPEGAEELLSELDARKDGVDLTVGISSHDDGPTTVYFNIVTS